MALTDTDRRRFFLATTLTLLALPALWWVNQSENSAAPNVAVAGADVGVDVGADHESPDDDAPVATAAPTQVADPASTVAAAGPTTVVTTAAPAQVVVDDDDGRVAPVFLEGPSGEVGPGLAEIAVPARPEIARVTTTATFRSSVGHGACMVPGIINGRTVTIVNLNTSRSVTCVTVLTPGQLSDQLTLSTSMFAEFADLTDAPIPVEIRQ